MRSAICRQTRPAARQVRAERRNDTAASLGEIRDEGSGTWESACCSGQPGCWWVKGPFAADLRALCHKHDREPRYQRTLSRLLNSKSRIGPRCDQTRLNFSRGNGYPWPAAIPDVRTRGRNHEPVDRTAVA